ARCRAAVADRKRPALGEDPHLQLSREPGHRPPDQAHGAPARPRPRGTARRVHGRPRGRGAAGLARVTVREALRAAEERLARAGIDTPRLDAELLLAHALGVTRSQLFAAPDDEAPAGFEPLLARREAREPLAYVLGEWGFRRLTLATDRRALRPPPPAGRLLGRSPP